MACDRPNHLLKPTIRSGTDITSERGGCCTPEKGGYRSIVTKSNKRTTLYSFGKLIPELFRNNLPDLKTEQKLVFDKVAKQNSIIKHCNKQNSVHVSTMPPIKYSTAKHSTHLGRCFVSSTIITLKACTWHEPIKAVIYCIKVTLLVSEREKSFQSLCRW